MFSKLALRSKLLLLIALPLLAGLVLASLRIADGFESADTAQSELDQVNRLAELAGVVDALNRENAVLVDGSAPVTALAEARQAFDEAAATVLANPDAYPAESVAAVQAVVDRVGPLRESLGDDPAALKAELLATAETGGPIRAATIE
ncbi:MAG TPA: hypothetical protein VIY72_01810, partial [Acidimicrobiales bacterium]